MRALRSASFVLFGCALGLAACASEEDAPTIGASANLTAPPDAASWMGLVDAHASLSALSIPGTHESCARHEPIPGTAKCQDLTLDAQLAAGVRYLDVRCRHFEDHFEIHHDLVYQQMSFDDVLSAVIPFLEKHGSETVIMSIKQEYDPSNVTRTFEQTFDAYRAKNPARWYVETAVPTLERARGKIALLRRFDATGPLGIDARHWGDDATFSIDGAARLRVQDEYKVGDNGAKWTAVTALFDEALRGDEGTLYLNYTSGYKPLLFGIPNVTDVASAINPKLAGYFSTDAKKGRYGVVAMDFVDAKRAGLVFQQNFR